MISLKTVFINQPFPGIAMSQPFDNDFNNNQNPSASDIQNINNSEAELQQTSEEKSVDIESDNIQTDEQEQSQDEEKRPEDKERSDDADTNVGSSENQPETASEETASSPDASDKDEKEESEPDIPDNPLDNLPKETASNADNNYESRGVNAFEQSTPNVSNDNDNGGTFNEEIQKKIDAVKDFAFCKKGNKKIPIYPYVVALTGHRNVDITDAAVKAAALKQLRSLAQAWDNACLIKSLFFEPIKTAPLIALVGLSDGNSGRMWAEFAATLRDKENFNIKIVAVSSMPLNDLHYMALKHPDILSQTEDYDAAKNNFDYIINASDGVIELPYEQDVREYIELYKELERSCTDNSPHSNELFKILIGESKPIQNLQFKEYRKFMCVHSHALIALSEDAEQWKKANLAGIDIDQVAKNNSNEIKVTRIPFEEKLKARDEIKKMIEYVKNLRFNKGIQAEPFDNLIQSFKDFAKQLFPTFQDDIPRTNAMIFYKLFGNVDSALIPDKHRFEGISFTSIGPAVCIHTGHSTGGSADKTSSGKVTIIVKDQPNDKQAELTKKFVWNKKGLAEFKDIKSIITEISDINKRLYKHSFFSQKEKVSDDDLIKSFLGIRKGDQFETIPLDDNARSLLRHYCSTKNLSRYYYFWMKFWTRLFALLAIVFLTYLSKEAISNATVSFFALKGLSVLGVAIIIYLNFKNHLYYHYYYALANGTRIQFYWNLAEINKDVPGQFNLHQISEISWLRAAFNGLGVAISNEPPQNAQDVFGQSLDKCKFIKKYWVDSKNNELAGKRDLNFIEYVLDKVTFFKTYIEDILLFLSPSKGYVATGVFFILVQLLSPYLKDHSRPLLENAANFLCFVLSVIIVYNVYRKSSLKNLNIKQNHQLLYPYRRSQLLLEIKMRMWKISYDQKHDNCQIVMQSAFQELKKILEDLGRIELAINAEWLLGADEREFVLSNISKKISSMKKISTIFFSNNKE